MWGEQFASLSLRADSLAQVQRAHFVAKSPRQFAHFPSCNSHFSVSLTCISHDVIIIMQRMRTAHGQLRSLERARA